MPKLVIKPKILVKLKKIFGSLIENDKLTVTIVPIREGMNLHKNKIKTRIL
jgi:hypothetical protein